MSDQYHVAPHPPDDRVDRGHRGLYGALLFFLGKGRPKVVPRLIALAAVVAVGAVSFSTSTWTMTATMPWPGTTPRRRWRPTPPPGWSTPSSHSVGTIWRPMPPMTPLRPRPSSASTRTG